MKKITIIFAILFFAGFQNGKAQDFITTWNTGNFSAITSFIKFKSETTGTVSYTWQSLPPATPQSGSGTFTGPNDNISLPANIKIRLSIQPANFRRFIIDEIGFFEVSNLLSVDQWGSVIWTSMEDAFKFGGILAINATDIPNLSQVTSMKNMFMGCFSLDGLFNINSWSTSNVANMSGLFQRSSFNQAISNWNTSNVTDMSDMFNSARSFNLNLNNWNTSKVTNMARMFLGAYSFNRPLSNWNTAKVTNFSQMFSDSSLFSGFTLAFNQNIGMWNTSLVTDMSGMFTSAKNFNQNIGNWNTSNVTNMSEMFLNATAFNQNIGNWNTSNVINMSKMFANQPSNQLFENQSFANGGSNSIQNWNVANVTNMLGMFQRANNFNVQLGNWNLNPAVNLTNMLDSSGMSCKNYSATIIGWNANPTTPNNKVLGATFMEYGAQAIAAVNNMVTNKGWGFSGHDYLNVTPSFQSLNPYCSGSIITALPTISDNNVAGTWSPALSNTTTGQYTFTPNPNECATASATLNVTILPRPVITGSASQVLNSNATVAQIVVSPSTVVWYGSLANAQSETNPIPNSSLIANGNYYAVTTSGNCPSLPFMVAVTTTLSNNEFNFSNLKYFPNPTSNILNLSYSDAFTNIEVLNFLGQKVLTSKPNSKEVQIDLSDLNSGNYFIKINAGDAEKVIKIMKL